MGNGLDIEEEISEIQQMMGICPQDHVIFQELSGRQHIRFWAMFKSLSSKEMKVKNNHDTENTTPVMTDEDIDILLDRVILLEHANQLAKNYSGGMQRKLGLAMATVGNP